MDGRALISIKSRAGIENGLFWGCGARAQAQGETIFENPHTLA